MSHELDFDESFDALYGAPIIIPQDFLFYRGYDTQYPAVSEWPSHYGSLSTATSYSTAKNRTLGYFTNSKPLKLLDFRYMKTILQELFKTRKDNSESSVGPIVRTSFAYGISGLHDQIQLGKRMFPSSPGTKALIEFYKTFIENREYMDMPLNMNPVTAEGVRVAETMNDGYVLTFIRDAFGDWVDGFIAQRMITPYHVEKQGTINPEIIIFNPIKSRIVQISLPKTPANHISIIQILNMQTQRIEIKMATGQITHRIPRGGNHSTPSQDNYNYSDSDNDSDEFFNALTKKQKDAVALYKTATKAAKVWKRRFEYLNYYTPHPTSEVNDWQR
jgi:hypothetical protein